MFEFDQKELHLKLNFEERVLLCSLYLQNSEVSCKELTEQYNIVINYPHIFALAKNVGM